MPNATVSNAVESKDLTTLPEGYVKLKRMSYGESVQRRALMKMSFISESGSKDFAGEMAMASVDIQVYEFGKCIVEHNLEDEHGQKLRLDTKSGLEKLDPIVGGEIEKFISEMNDFDADSEDETKN